MFRVGATVLFGRPNGEKTRGRITKVNRKSYKITSLSETYGRPKRPELEILKDIDRVYGELSPENLHCDGEISHSAAMAKERSLNARLKTLFKELGREVSESETYRAIYHNGLRGRF